MLMKKTMALTYLYVMLIGHASDITKAALLGGTLLTNPDNNVSSVYCVYRANDTHFTWEGAQTFCQNIGGQLAVLDTKQKQEAIRSKFGGYKLCPDKSFCHVWLAGKMKKEYADEWNWISPTQINYSQIPTDLNGNPNYCGLLLKGESVGFKIHYCNEKAAPLCRYSKNSMSAEKCTGQLDHVHFKYLEKTCVAFYKNNNTTWYKARNMCIENGGDLFVPESQTEMDVVADALLYNAGNRFGWIGFQRWLWYWDRMNESSPVTYSRWTTQSAVSKMKPCMYTDLIDDTKWYDKECDGPGLAYAMCEIEHTNVCPGKKNVATTTSSTKSTSTTLAADSNTNSKISRRSTISVTNIQGTTQSTADILVNSTAGINPNSGTNVGNVQTIIMSAVIPSICLLLIIVIIILVVKLKRRKNNDNSSQAKSNRRHRNIPAPDTVYANNDTSRDELPDAGPLGDSINTNTYCGTISRMPEYPAYQEPGPLLPPPEPLYAEAGAAAVPHLVHDEPQVSASGGQVRYATVDKEQKRNQKKKDKGKKSKPANSTISHTLAPGTEDMYALPDKQSVQRPRQVPFIPPPSLAKSSKGGLDML